MVTANLHRRLAALASFLTVTVMFGCIAIVKPNLKDVSTKDQVLGVVAAALASLGTYTLLLRGIAYAFYHVRSVRRVALSGAYLEGTWVGYYSKNGASRFTVEFFDQGAGDLVIRGREFDESGFTTASWSSTASAIDLVARQVVYTYQCRVFDRQSGQDGMGVFMLLSPSGGRRASVLDGYAVDLIDGTRDPNTEFKVADRELDHRVAIGRAHELSPKTIPPLRS